MCVIDISRVNCSYFLLIYFNIENVQAQVDKPNPKKILTILREPEHSVTFEFDILTYV